MSTYFLIGYGLVINSHNKVIYTLETKCRTFSFPDDVTTWWWLDSKALDRAWRSFCQTVSDRADAAL